MSDEPKRKYEPPQIMNISGQNVEGQTQGFCQEGSAIRVESCTDGTSPFTVGVCDVGTGPTVANPCAPTGAFPTFGYCAEGNGAIEGCTSGGNHALGSG